MAATKPNETSASSTSWTYNPSFTPAQKPDYDYKAGIVATLNASAVTQNGTVPAYKEGMPKSDM